MSDADEKSPAEVVVELAVYAPLGLAMTIGEAVPQLVDKGRARFGPQVALARALGQFAVRQGAQQLRASAGSAGLPRLPRLGDLPLFGRSRWPAGGGSGARGAGHSAGTSGGGQEPAAYDQAGRQRHTSPTVDLGARAPTSQSSASTRRPGPGPAASAASAASAAGLAIPSYDSLSASQVVQRLAGLSRGEIEAVRAYERRTRGRRTILARAEQLLA